TPRPPPPPTLFPYTTLFRSPQRHDQAEALQPLVVPEGPEEAEAAARHERAQEQRPVAHVPPDPRPPGVDGGLPVAVDHEHAVLRSEEHTSELQSRENLVCRL